MIELNIPITEEQILSLHAGDAVAISGIGTTGRDAAHKYLVETLIEGKRPLSAEDQRIYDELKKIYRGGAIYHSGPILRNADGRWSIVSSGPTTSIRDEIYEDKVIAHFGLRVVIGKGGMGPRTLAACKAHKAVYVHGIGGAGVDQRPGHGRGARRLQEGGVRASRGLLEDPVRPFSGDRHDGRPRSEPPRGAG